MNASNSLDASNSNDASNTQLKDDISSMTANHSRNASNNWNESNNGTATTVWRPAKTGELAIVAKPATACMEANYNRGTITPGITAATGTIGTSWKSTSRTTRITQ
jgi:hypothetical protein